MIDLLSTADVAIAIDSYPQPRRRKTKSTPPEVRDEAKLTTERKVG